eukprot:Ihof_evm1s870 gene=Ihof_evmTU1s870
MRTCVVLPSPALKQTNKTLQENPMCATPFDSYIPSPPLNSYMCNEWIIISSVDNDLDHPQGQLDQVRGHKYSESRTRSGRVIRAAVLRAPMNLGREGKLYDILYRWRFLLVAKAFNSWQAFIEEHKKDDKESLEKSPSNSDGAERRGKKRARSNIIPGHIGLRNLGNTCFMNSVLQALSHTPILKHYFVGMEIPKPQPIDDDTSSMTSSQEDQDVTPTQSVRRRDMGWCFDHVTRRVGVRHSRKDWMNDSTVEPISLSHEIHAILRVMWSGKWGLVTPHAMLHAVWRLIPSFRGYMQQDAQEFMCQLLDHLQDELNKPPTTLDLWSSFYPNEYKRPGHASSSNIINATFGGTLQSEVLCGRCRSRSTTTELFLDLSLDFPQAVGLGSTASLSLIDMLDAFTRTEDLDGKVYMCENCNRDRSKPPILTHASKKLTLQSLPYVLRLHLKRIKWEGSTREKIRNHVDFPIHSLDMSAYCEGVESFDRPSNSHMYDLYAIINHHGTGFNTGHYTCYCLGQDT